MLGIELYKSLVALLGERSELVMHLPMTIAKIFLSI